MNARVLVVDDSDVDRCLIAGLLRKKGSYDVELAVDGQDAMQRMAAAPADIVVTDLLMPRMDGLALLERMRHTYPAVPVILLTAFGNEEVAVEALRCGAASYVPKARQAELLVDVVDRVREHTEADRRRSRLAEFVLEYQWRFALENDPGLIRVLVDQVQETMASIGFADVGERIRLGEALEEALLNAMYHGNLELGERELAEAKAELDGRKLASLLQSRQRQSPYRDRRILVIVKINPTEARFVIRDEGAGFRVPSMAEIDPVKSFDLGQRRGLTLIRSMMDEVKFNEIGNELTMCKRRLSPFTAQQQRN